jgi:hypothetical protein
MFFIRPSLQQGQGEGLIPILGEKGLAMPHSYTPCPLREALFGGASQDADKGRATSSSAKMLAS